jgi:acyl-CoA synthetase (AMP-forming)/AMP-acid ligase II
MAEATLSVASIDQNAAASAIYLDREQLGLGRAVTVAPDAPGAVAHVSCGQPIPDQWVVIASPDGAEVPDATVGEIWLYGNNIARGYFRREEETRRVFGNRLQSRLRDASHAEGAPDDSFWLATGDLGVYIDGELYLTGRIKDLIIIDGSNHYPHDIETTVSEASSAIRTGYVAAFSVPSEASDPSGGQAGEQVVVVAERGTGAGRADPEEIAETVRAAVSRQHHIRLADLKLVAAGAIPRTTSGKLARNACRAAYIAGRFNR